ncbi:transcriptional regulator [Pseudomonas aeruginosa]|uniref:helix-turn-helix domain-containing protein n=1 Tax=Pseudomonas aeruginosa TaxID=287 RepID=UPI00289862AF|nr:transcriptional regulator [Pseudomonas aeruginosa]
MNQLRYIEKWITFQGTRRLLRLRVPDILERARIINEIQIEVAEGTLSFGGAIRRLRREVTDLPQDLFARMCKISTRTLVNLEAEVGNPTIHSLSSVFRLFGMRLSLEKTGALSNEEQIIDRLNRLGLQVKAPESGVT